MHNNNKNILYIIYVFFWWRFYLFNWCREKFSFSFKHSCLSFHRFKFHSFSENREQRTENKQWWTKNTEQRERRIKENGEQLTIYFLFCLAKYELMNENNSSWPFTNIDGYIYVSPVIYKINSVSTNPPPLLFIQKTILIW